MDFLSREEVCAWQGLKTNVLLNGGEAIYITMYNRNTNTNRSTVCVIYLFYVLTFHTYVVREDCLSQSYISQEKSTVLFSISLPAHSLIAKWVYFV